MSKKESKSGDKPYKCADCGSTFITWTNHHGTTWNNCKKCSNQNSLSLCMTDEGIALRQEDRDNTIEVEIVTYRLNTDTPEGREQYDKILEHLEEMGTKWWQVMEFQAGSIKHLIKRFQDPEQLNKLQGYIRTDRIKLSTRWISSNQWNEPDGPRVFDSHEIEYPNKPVKEGYYLIITDEIRELRHNRLQCGYCGFQSTEGQVGDHRKN
jgi:DNA-directed RNA polymerase subunit RPC12/RpoP